MVPTGGYELAIEILAAPTTVFIFTFLFLGRYPRESEKQRGLTGVESKLLQFC